MSSASISQRPVLNGPILNGTWIIYAFTRIFPATVPMTYVLGALQVGMMLWAAWLIGHRLLGAREACISVVLITCITFYASRMHFFNHNTARLAPCTACGMQLNPADCSGGWRWACAGVSGCCPSIRWWSPSSAISPICGRSAR